MQPNTDNLFILTAAAALVFMLIAWWQWRAAAKARARVAQLEQERVVDAHRREELDRLRTALEVETEKRQTADKEATIAQQRLADMDQRIRDAEEFKKAAVSSVMEIGHTVSSKLLEDHQRETKVAREQHEQMAQKTTKEVLKHVEQLSQSVAAIQSRASDNSKQMETVMRALTHPGGAGQMAEAGLENALKQLGLEPGRDYMLQYHIAREGEGNLRPDAVIFLSQDMVVVIDAKASKFLMELVEAEGSESEEAVLKKLVASAHQHIDKLSQKAYRDAVAKALKENNRTLGRRLMVMYVPSEAMIERLHRADPSIRTKCERADIILSGPASLAAILSLSRQQIAEAKQDENQERIIAEVSRLMGSLATTLGHVDAVGKGIQQSAEKFRDFGKSLNTRVLPKLRKLEQLGVQSDSNRALPKAIRVYDVYRHDELLQLEADDDGGEPVSDAEAGDVKALRLAEDA